MFKLTMLKSIRKSILISLVVLFSFPLLSFRDNVGYKVIDGKVIKKGFDTYYETGCMNIKFKNQVKILNENKSGINKLDEFLSEYNVSKLIQKHPLNKILAKRKIGDEALSEIYTVIFEKAVDHGGTGNTGKNQSVAWFCRITCWVNISNPRKCFVLPVRSVFPVVQMPFLD